MKHVLLRAPAFIRDSRRLIRKHPALAEQLLDTLLLLEAKPHAPALKTHKLKGQFKNSWACSGAYDLRIVFSFVTNSGNPAILLESIGTHDEVY